MKPMPLVCTPILKPKVWGGDRLAHWNKAVAPGARIGESWEVADLASTSADGAGGEAARSVVAEGVYAGRTLSDLIASDPKSVLGARGGDAFPLLVKFLDARENLSVQVHPSPPYAAAHPGAHLKFESWYILEATPGAMLYIGVRAGISREHFEAHIRDGSVVDDLVAISARAGDCHHLPSGTVHALGAGVLVAEVQTPSDTTFRVFDWGRTDRALHIEQALECAALSPPEPGNLRRADDSPRCALGGTAYYELAELCVEPDDPRVEPAAETARVWMTLGGAGVIECPRGSLDPVTLDKGRTVVLPAALGEVRVRAAASLRLLEATPR